MFNNKKNIYLLLGINFIFYIILDIVKGFCLFDIIFIIIYFIVLFEIITFDYNLRVKLNEELIYNIKTIIHDLKNPIQSLILFIDYIRLKYEKDDDIQKVYEILNDLYKYIDSNKKIYLGVNENEVYDISINQIIDIVKRINEYTFKDTNILIYNCENNNIKKIYPYYLVRIFQNILTNIVVHNDVNEILIKCFNKKEIEIIFNLSEKINAKNIVNKLKFKYFIAQYFYTGTGLSIIYKLSKLNNIKVSFYEKKNFVITKLIFN